jgi:hypothetical protein
MKYPVRILFFVLLLNGMGAFAQSVTIGMTLDEVGKIYPNMKMSTYQKSVTLERPDTLFGLSDSWGYRFEGDTLTWIFFHKYIDEINEANFRKCLNATQELIKEYTLFYGNPDTTMIGDTTFRNPYQQKHWGYDVLEARWKDVRGMKIKIEFTFMGGKGEYSLLVKIHYFDKNYPYFD